MRAQGVGYIFDINLLAGRKFKIMKNKDEFQARSKGRAGSSTKLVSE